MAEQDLLDRLMAVWHYCPSDAQVSVRYADDGALFTVKTGVRHERSVVIPLIDLRSITVPGLLRALGLEHEAKQADNDLPFASIMSAVERVMESSTTALFLAADHWSKGNAPPPEGGAVAESFDRAYEDLKQLQRLLDKGD